MLCLLTSCNYPGLIDWALGGVNAFACWTHCSIHLLVDRSRLSKTSRTQRRSEPAPRDLDHPGTAGHDHQQGFERESQELEYRVGVGPLPSVLGRIRS